MNDIELDWLLNAMACRFGQPYDAEELDRCWLALQKTRAPGQSDGDLARAIIKSFFTHACA